MCFRLACALLLSCVLYTISQAQQITSDVVVQGASVNDGYGGRPGTCGAEGQVYRIPSGVRLTSVMRVSRDGSSLLFTLPEHVPPHAVAVTRTGVNVLSNYSLFESRSYFQMFHFDSQANVLAENHGIIPVSTTAMAALPSGRTILAGTHSNDPNDQDEWKYGFAILDQNDKLVRSVDLPLPPGGSGWTFASEMAAGDGVAYVMLHSHQPPQTAIATISEQGNQNLDIKVIAAPLDTETRRHNQWVFGPGVAVDVYHYSDERPHPTMRFDEYDLNSGAMVGTKSAPPTGFQFGCYMGDEFSMLAHSAHVDPARHLTPDTLRLVITKLQ